MKLLNALVSLKSFTNDLEFGSLRLDFGHFAIHFCVQVDALIANLVFNQDTCYWCNVISSMYMLKVFNGCPEVYVGLGNAIIVSDVYFS